MKKQLLLHGGGFARISGPEGSEGAEPLGKTREGLLLADLRVSLLAIAKSPPPTPSDTPSGRRSSGSRSPSPPRRRSSSAATGAR